MCQSRPHRGRVQVRESAAWFKLDKRGSLLGEVVGGSNYCRQVHQPKTHASYDTGRNTGKIA